MGQYTYTGINSQNEKIQGMISAQTREAALSTLRDQGVKPLNVDESKASKNILSFAQKVKLKDLVVFTRELATMIDAGVPIVRSLATLQAQTENKFFKEALTDITRRVESGATLGDALAEHPKIFNNIYVNMVKAGEEGGILDEVLLKLALQTEKDAAIRTKVKSAMTYPMVITFITVGAFYGLMTIVVPKLGKIIESMGAPLPKLTKVMLSIGAVMSSPAFFFLFPLSIIVGLVAFRRYIQTENGRYNFHLLLLKIPVIKTLITKVAVARFARIFSSLMAAGVSVLQAIDATSNAIGNKVIQKELTEASKQVRNGTQLSAALSGSKIFPPIVSQMLAVGEETGQIDKVLIKVAEFYEDEVDAFVAGLTSIIEPLMIMVLGAMVGLVAASVFGPLSSLTQSIK
jgi:type IV pilus assembly protein PilC